MIADAEQTVLHIFFGSQTGTAEQEARLFELQCRERGFQTETSALDEYPLERFPEIEFAVFFVSTTGQGDAPRNMQRFWSFLLTKSLPGDSLAGLRFSLFGFGDSSYRKYNVMARMLYQRLQQLGAAAFTERGLGDDRAEGGYSLALNRWKKSFFEALALRFKLSQPQNLCYSGLQRPPAPVFTVRVFPAAGAPQQGAGPALDSPEAVLSKVHGHSVSQSTLLENRRLTAADHFQDVREIVFTKPQETGFEPGAVCAVYPSNSPAVVSSLLSYYALAGEDRVELVRGDGSSFLATTAGQLFGQVLDLSSAPRFFFFKLLSFYTEQQLYREKVAEMEFEDYYAYAVRERRTLDEILFDFKGVRLPLDILASFVGFLKPRDYSVASSSKKHPGLIRLTVALVQFATAANRQVVGVCSRHFAGLKPGDPVYYRLKPGTLAFPADSQAPVLLVGPGTGVAPFISLLEEREAAGPMSRHKTLVFFGCRHREKDFLHREYLSQLQKAEKITLFTAFSREQDSKVYVQHVILNNSFRLKAYLQEHEQQVRIFVAGNSKDMPQAVEKALRQVFGEAFAARGESAFEQLSREERIQFETWS